MIFLHLSARTRVARTLERREVFFASYMPAQKTDLKFLCAQGANSAKLLATVLFPLYYFLSHLSLFLFGEIVL